MNLLGESTQDLNYIKTEHQSSDIYVMHWMNETHKMQQKTVVLAPSVSAELLHGVKMILGRLLYVSNNSQKIEVLWSTWSPRNNLISVI